MNNKPLISKEGEEHVPLGEITVRSDSNFTLLTSNRDGIAKRTGLASNFNPLKKKLLERSNVHNLIFHRLRTVDCEGYSLLLPLGTCCTSSTHFRSKVSTITNPQSNGASKRDDFEAIRFQRGRKKKTYQLLQKSWGFRGSTAAQWSHDDLGFTLYRERKLGCGWIPWIWASKFQKIETLHGLNPDPSKFCLSEEFIISLIYFLFFLIG